MDAFIPYFSDGAWFLLHQAHLTTLTLLILLFFVYSLSDYRRALMLSAVFAAATLAGMILSASELFHLRSALVTFLLPFLATLLALFNILGAGAKHSAILEKTGYAIDILFGIILGLSMGSGYGQAGGTVFPLLSFTLGLAVGVIIGASGSTVRLVAGGLFRSKPPGLHPGAFLDRHRTDDSLAHPHLPLYPAIILSQKT